MTPTEYRSVEKPFLLTLQKLGWVYKSPEEIEALRSSYDDIFISAAFEKNLLRLNPSLSVSDVKALINKLRRLDDAEEFYAWLKGEKTFKPQSHDKSASIQLIDFEDIGNNEFWATNQYVCTISKPEDDKKHIRPDIVLFVNGIPLSVIECKFVGTPGSNNEEGIRQLNRYKRTCPELFIPNTFNC